MGGNNFKNFFRHFLIFVVLINGVFLTTTNSDLDDDFFTEVESSTTPISEKTAVVEKDSENAKTSESPPVITSLTDHLNFYTTNILEKHWPNFKEQISMGCQRNMEKYMEGLRRGEIWALKMDDAGGKYSTGWFWGNYYWLGSENLCSHIKPKLESTDISQNKTRISRKAHLSVRTTLDPSSPSQARGYQAGPMSAAESFSPFSVSFYVMRVHLITHFTHEEKILNIGLCLPEICRNDDVKTILKETSAASKEISLDVQTVRSHYSRYDIWHDKTFIILCCATLVVSFFLAAGTLFDYYLEHRKNKKLATSNLGHLSVTGINKTNRKGSIYVVNSKPDKMHENDGNNNGNLQQHLQTQNTENISKTVASLPAREPVARLIARELLLSFSVRANLRTICDQSVGSDTIPVLHGLKAISMLWVILGHTCIVAFKYSDNMEYRKVVQKDFFFQTVTNGAFSVDTFFFTSGLLVAFLYFRANNKGKLDPLSRGKNGFVAGMLHFWGLITYRFARLTAPYLYALGIVEVTMKWFNYNSVFEPPANDHENCPNYWWRNLLYINTLFPVNEMCMLWSWYISDDTQFYTVSAVLLILATSHFKSAVGLLVVFMTSSWATTGYIAYTNSHMPGGDDPLALFDKIYDKPWTRFGPYLIGMCVGWVLFKKDCKIKMNKLTVIAGWALSIACLISLVYGLYNVDLSPFVAALYSSLSHSAWAFSLSWIVVACVTGYGGYVNKILSATILYPFSRVTYCAYLIHPISIRLMVMSMDSPLHLGSFVTIVLFFGQAVISYVFAFVVSVAFEAPIVSMLRIITKVVANRKGELCGNPT